MPPQFHKIGKVVRSLPFPPEGCFCREKSPFSAVPPFLKGGAPATAKTDRERAADWCWYHEKFVI